MMLVPLHSLYIASTWCHVKGRRNPGPKGGVAWSFGCDRDDGRTVYVPVLVCWGRGRGKGAEPTLVSLHVWLDAHNRCELVSSPCMRCDAQRCDMGDKVVECFRGGQRIEQASVRWQAAMCIRRDNTNRDKTVTTLVATGHPLFSFSLPYVFVAFLSTVDVCTTSFPETPLPAPYIMMHDALMYGLLFHHSPYYYLAAPFIPHRPYLVLSTDSGLPHHALYTQATPASSCFHRSRRLQTSLQVPCLVRHRFRTNRRRPPLLPVDYMCPPLSTRD